MSGRGAQAAACDLLELLAVVSDTPAGAAQREGWPDDRRQSHQLQRRHRLVERADEAAPGALEADPLHRLTKQLPVLGLGDRLLASPDKFHVVSPQCARA